MNDTKALVLETVTGLARFLHGCQVITGDIEVDVPDGETISVDYQFLRRDPGPYPLEVRRQGADIWLRAIESEAWHGPLVADSFVRVFPGRGIRNPARGGGGITFRYPGGAETGRVILEAYDRGGIWDDLPNMEVFIYEPQVAATFYADAYSAWIFAWLASRGEKQYREPAAMALDFVQRIYPVYTPMIMDGLNHSDFKNPAFIEAVEELAVDWAQPEQLERWRKLFPGMVNDDAYSPTNVHALRYHWRAVRQYYTGLTGAEPQQYLKRVFADATDDGLIHDNNTSELSFGGHTDAHDLTYHLYTLACLVRGYQYLPLPEVLATIERGANFSLSLTTSGGEVSYLGRGANNVYHLASAFYTFAFMAKQQVEQAGRFRRAATLILNYIRGFQQESGEIATALNRYPEERMGWNHCHTPYNGLTAYLLAQALPLLTEEGEQSLVLEGKAKLLYPEARYAAVSTKDYYAVFFGGNALSYPWSGCHKTGVAGLAHLGVQGRPGQLPILEQSLREGEWSTGDLPDVVSADGDTAVPAGLGSLQEEADGFSLELEYGGFQARQVYRPEANGLLLETTLVCLNPGHYQLAGLPTISVLVDSGWRHEVSDKLVTCSGPNGNLRLEVLDVSEPGEWQTFEESSTARGLHSKLARVVDREFSVGDTLTCRVRITVGI
ncbi:MAG: hypothetical protein FH749_13405 [Firmicutes bacterium]|nr:hypothetical protein [Bacillota bacterium]